MLRKLMYTLVLCSLLNANEGGELELEVGAVSLGFTGLYHGAKTQVDTYPLFVVRYKDFYFEGLLAGYKLYGDEKLKISIETIPTLYDYESKISDFLDGMADREMSYETGLSFEYMFEKSQISFKLLKDWQNIHDGWSLSGEYRDNLLIDKSYIFSAYLGAEYMDAKKSDYYYGVLEDEARVWREAYKVGGAESGFVGADYIYLLNSKIVVMTNLEYKHYSNSITNSPIVDKHYQASAYVAVLYKIK